MKQTKKNQSLGNDSQNKTAKNHATCLAPIAGNNYNVMMQLSHEN